MALQYLKNVTTLQIDSAKCIGCGRCAEVCPHRVFQLDSGKATIRNKNRCMECGACARNCPAGALNVRAGVGCAYAIVLGKLTGTAPSCGEPCGTEEDGKSSGCC